MDKRFTTGPLLTYAQILFPRTWAIILFLTLGVGSNALQAQTVQKRLYLSSGNKLDRSNPANPLDNTISTTAEFYKNTSVLFSSASAKTSQSGASGGLTFSYTTGSGSNQLLIVGIACEPTAKIDSVKFGNSRLSLLDTVRTGNTIRSELWYLANPTAGTTANIIIYWTGTMEATAGAASFSSVDQTIPLDQVVKLSTNATQSSLSVPSSLGDVIFDVVGTNGNAQVDTSGFLLPNRTRIFADGTNDVKSGSSLRSATVGTTTMSWKGATQSFDWAQLGVAIKGESNDITFSLDSALCSNFTIPSGQPITIKTYATITSGTMPSTAYVTAVLYGGGNKLGEFTTATWNASDSTLTWTGTLSSTANLTTGQSIDLVIFNSTPSVRFRLNYDAVTRPSYIDFPTSTYINVGSGNIFDASYPGGATATSTEGGRPVFLRATASDPFGNDDISGIDFQVTRSGGSTTTYAGVLKASSGCSSTYEYAWTPNTIGTYTINAVAKEGTEGTVTHTRSLSSTFNVTAPPFEVDHTLVSPVSGLYKPGDTLTYQIVVRNLSSTKSIPTLPLQSLYNAGCLQYLRTPSGYPILTDSSAGAITWNNLAPLAASSNNTVRAQFKVLAECAPARNIARVQGAVFSDNYPISTLSDTVDVAIDNYPLAVNDSVCLNAQTTISVLANDSDPDTTGAIGATGSSYTVQIVTSPVKGTASVVGKTIQYTPASLAENELTTFTYRVLDATGLADTATIAVRYSVTNDAPIAAADASTAIAGVPKIVAVLANDSDADGTLQTLSVTVQPTYGRVTVNADKTITYTSFIGYTGLDPFTYQICDNGCPGSAACATATVTMDVLEGYVFCDDSTNTLTTPAVAGATKYSWTFPSGVTPVTGTTTSSSPNVVVETTTPEVRATWATVTTGSFFPVCVTAINDCGAGTTTCLRMMVNRLSATLDSTDIACYGQKSGAIDLAVSGGSTPYSYSWSNGVKSQDLNAVGAGNYQVTVSDKFGCKYISPNVSLSEPTQLSVSASVTNQTTEIPANGALDISVSGGTPSYAYAWSNDYSIADLSALEGGTYTITITDANGCTDTTSFTVPSNVIPLKISSLVKTDVLCNGGMTGAIDLEVVGGSCSGAYTYSWSKDGGAAFATTQDLSGLGTGVYSVTVSCTGSTPVTGSVTITQPASALNTSIASSTNLSCKDANDGAIDLAASGGTAPYSYYWSNTETTQDISGLTAGTYTVTTTDANGCTETEDGNRNHYPARFTVGVCSGHQRYLYRPVKRCAVGQRHRWHA